eukprot:CAMPEP_0181138880 /NCGR_PEP_ID=MMETSP1071-20121207/34483_1 /TAXON_ID=35127 /ORGANISM="Thalassiosira sp., Strain NH16" /LENGTH=535 /DNA_ID=CAMNT_0023225747 /DNA_START=357 /DNA_END=1964 /DNA_ORIENTATION=-
MSRRSSRTSSVAASAKISAGTDDAIDGAPSENESSTTEVLKGSEKPKAGDATKPTPKRKKAGTKKGKSKDSLDDEEDPKPKKKAAPKKRKSKSAATSDDEHSESPKTKKKASPKKKVATKKGKPNESSGDEDDTKPKVKAAAPKRKSKSSPTSDDEPSTKKQKSPKKKAADHQRWTERTPLTRHWNPAQAMESSGSYTFTVISWNVAGLRAFVKKQPDALMNLAEKYHADVICLQETKLQEGHLDDKKLKLREHFEEHLGGYESHWSYSLEKKGYSGTAMFIKKRGGGGKIEDGNANNKKGKKQATLGAYFGNSKKDESKNGASTEEDAVTVTGDVHISHLQPVNVDTELGLPAHDGEGRAIVADFPLFYLTNLYVPNSGAKLERLGYRTEQWDADLLTKMQQLEKEGGKPVIWLGDLNVAHNEKDTWNEGAKHLSKSAGTTAEERSSFERQLGEGYVDAFRHLHPQGRGHYSYWSQRAGNREPNKGLRLDYFICSKEMMEDGDGSKAIIRDSYILPDEVGSDHCPIVLEIEIKK